MGWQPKNAEEANRRNAGRRRYNRGRRLERARRITAIFRLLDMRDYKGRELAALFGVQEATISRDLRFIRRVKRDWERSIVGRWGFKMYAHNFRFILDARGWETSFLFKNGVRVK
jgi:hypothetical protein